MSKVHVCNVVVCNNPAPFLDQLQFEITFDCIETLGDDLQWKIIYVGSAETEDYDQTLEQVFVGPVYEGRHRFLFQANPPDTQKLPKDAADVIGLTLIMLTCSYRSKEFIRIGYYVNVQYTEKELEEHPPEQPIFSKMQRKIMAEKSRVTKFPIKWDDAPNFHSVISENQVKKKSKKEKEDKDVIDLDITSPVKHGKKSTKNATKSVAVTKRIPDDILVSDQTEEEVDDEEEKKKFLSSLLERDETETEAEDTPKASELSKDEDKSKDKEIPKTKEVLNENVSDENIEITDDEPMIVDNDSKNKDAPETKAAADGNNPENKENNKLQQG